MHTQTCISTWLVHPQTNPHLCFQHSWTMMACPGTTSPLHSLKSSPSLCLGYTLTHTQTHLTTLKTSLLIFFFPLAFSHCSLLSLSLLPPSASLSLFQLPCFPRHTFQTELQPARTRTVAPLQSPEELLSAIPCLSQTKHCKKTHLPVALFTVHSHHQHHLHNKPPKAKVYAKI